MRIAICNECGRKFDLTKESDANEFYYGHDCDETNQSSVE